MPDNNLKRVSSKRRRSGSRKLSGNAAGLDPSHLKDEVDAEAFERDWGLSPSKEVRTAGSGNDTQALPGRVAGCSSTGAARRSLLNRLWQYWQSAEPLLAWPL